MNIKKILAVLFLSLIMTGCKVQQHIQQTRSQYEVPPFELYLPEYAELSEAQIPGDVRLVTAAIVEQMRQVPQSIESVTFDENGKHILAEPGFNFQGFSISSVVVQDYQVRELASNDFLCWLTGTITFTDSLNRKTVNYYQAEYRMTASGINVSRSVTYTVPPIFPEVQAYTISRQEMGKVASRFGNDFPGFYSHVVANAQSMTPTPEEVRQKREFEEMTFFQRVRSTPLRERQDNVMVVFVMDRVTPDSEIEVVVTGTLHERISAVTPEFLDFSGWRVAIFGGEFAVDRDVFYTKVYYKPAKGVLPEGNEQVLVGLFTSQKNYETRYEAGPVQQETPVALAEGPLAQGRMILDTANRNDAVLIQSRLAELGFYTMKVDGLWGPGSRGALQNFQMSNGLSANGVWDMGTQMRLFAGTGK